MDRSYRRVSRAGAYARRRGSSSRGADVKTEIRTIKLIVCVSIFVLAALIKALFPDFIAAVGVKIATTVDYKSALTALGEGISGEKKFISAVGEAITYAFKGVGEVEMPSGEESNGEADPAFSGYDGTEQIFGDSELSPDGESAVPDIIEEDSVTDAEEDAEAETGAGAEMETTDLTSAIIAAFLETQETYSDYKLPAGTTYDMPTIGVAYVVPLVGVMTSGFGFRTHPVDGLVKFHYGIDIAADKDAPIAAFADGSVVAVGESTTLGLYIIIAHDGAQTLYAHCGEIYVSTDAAVKMGERIAVAGDSGNATGDCLHFELKVQDVWVNPEYYLYGQMWI